MLSQQWQRCTVGNRTTAYPRLLEDCLMLMECVTLVCLCVLYSLFWSTTLTDAIPIKAQFVLECLRGSSRHFHPLECVVSLQDNQ